MLLLVGYMLLLLPSTTADAARQEKMKRGEEGDDMWGLRMNDREEGEGEGLQ